jgi:GTP pyrophosphokinase
MPPKLTLSEDWKEPAELTRLLESVRDAHPGANLAKIRRAYQVAEAAHQGQERKSGRPYIEHPLAVAQILAEFRMDVDTICASLMHDVLEDSLLFERADLVEEFGAEVVSLVEGVTKLKFEQIGDLTERERTAAATRAKAETMRKLLLAIANDFRVIFIKLADRLHNMQTIDSLERTKQLRIARETMDVYAPLAARLGIWQMKWQLEDLSFRVLHPNEYQEVKELVGRSRTQREQLIAQFIDDLSKRLAKEGIRVLEIKGRPKHLFSIFSKMRQHHLSYDEIFDILAVRVIVEERNECYAALGVVHGAYTPLANMFGDYIGSPKPNGYQSLHTKVMGPHGEPVEIQIRTLEMHNVAEYGLAAHYTYKENRQATSDDGQYSQLRQQLFDWSSDKSSSSKWLQQVTTDLFSEQVFVFTPKGDVLDLPKGSTPVDFAFRIHSALGMALYSAKVNGRIVPLNTALKNGDIVEVLNRSSSHPSRDWLNFIKSAHARNKLKNYFSRIERDKNVQAGRESLTREARAQGIDPRTFLGEDVLKAISKQFEGVDSTDVLLAKVGTNEISAQNLIAKYRAMGEAARKVEYRPQIKKSREGELRVDGVAAQRAACCAPIPGDDIIGFISRTKGIMLHQASCANVQDLRERQPARMYQYEWPADGSVYAVHLRIQSLDRQGLMADVSNILAETKTNVSNMNVRTDKQGSAYIDADVDVPDRPHLVYVMNRIGAVEDVLSVIRLVPQTAVRRG